MLRQLGIIGRAPGVISRMIGYMEGIGLSIAIPSMQGALEVLQITVLNREHLFGTDFS
jgi:hypothetical protein